MHFLNILHGLFITRFFSGTVSDKGKGGLLQYAL